MVILCCLRLWAVKHPRCPPPRSTDGNGVSIAAAARSPCRVVHIGANVQWSSTVWNHIASSRHLLRRTSHPTTKSAIMATSTTTQVTSSEIRDLVQVYNVHHSGCEEQVEEEELQEQQLRAQFDSRQTPSSQQFQLSVPEEHQNDITSRRRVPPYRPTHRDHTLASRPAGLTAVSAAFTQTVFLGVYITGVRHKSRVPLFVWGSNASTKCTDPRLHRR